MHINQSKFGGLIIEGEEFPTQHFTPLRYGNETLLSFLCLKARNHFISLSPSLLNLILKGHSCKKHLKEEGTELHLPPKKEVAGNEQKINMITPRITFWA